MPRSKDVVVSVLSHSPWESSGGTAFAVRELTGWAAEAGYPVEVLSPRSSSPFVSTPPRSSAPAAALGEIPGEATGPSWERVVTLARAVLACRLRHRRAAARRQAWWVHGVDAALAFCLADPGNARPWIFHRHQLMEHELPGYFSSPGGRFAAGHLGRWLDGLPRRATVGLAVDAALPGRAVPGLVRRSTLAAVERHSSAPAGPRRVAYAGNAEAYQNLSPMLEACETLNIPLEVVTSRQESFREQLNSVPELEVRYVAGNQERQLSALAESRVMVVPREDRNGFPMKVLNGLALGLPLVVSERQSRLDGLPGVYLVAAHKSAERRSLAWAEAIRRALEGPPRFERNLERFTLEACSGQLTGAIESVAFLPRRSHSGL